MIEGDVMGAVSSGIIASGSGASASELGVVGLADGVEDSAAGAVA